MSQIIRLGSATTDHSIQATQPINQSYREYSRILHGFDKGVLSQTGKVTATKPEYDPSNIKKMLENESQLRLNRRQKLQEFLQSQFNRFEQITSPSGFHIKSNNHNKSTSIENQGKVFTLQSTNIDEVNQYGLTKSQSQESIGISTFKKSKILRSIKQFQKKREFLNGQRDIASQYEAAQKNQDTKYKSYNGSFSYRPQSTQINTTIHNNQDMDAMIQKQAKMELFREYRKQLDESNQAKQQYIQKQEEDKQFQSYLQSQVSVTGQPFRDFQQLQQKQFEMIPRRKTSSNQKRINNKSHSQDLTSALNKNVIKGYQFHEIKLNNDQEKSSETLPRFNVKDSRILYRQLQFQYKKKFRAENLRQPQLRKVDSSDSLFINTMRPLQNQKKKSVTRVVSMTQTQTLPSPVKKKDAQTAQISPEKPRTRNFMYQQYENFLNNSGTLLYDDINAIYELNEEDEDGSSTVLRSSEKSRQSILKKINSKSYVNKRFQDNEKKTYERPTSAYVYGPSRQKNQLTTQTQVIGVDRNDTLTVQRIIPLEKTIINLSTSQKNDRNIQTIHSRGKDFDEERETQILHFYVNEHPQIIRDYDDKSPGSL